MTNSEWIEKLRAAAAMCRSPDDDLDYKYWAAVAFDMLPKASGRITELEAQVAALKKIAIDEWAHNIYDAKPTYWYDPEFGEDDIREARRQLSEEHPEAFK